MCPPQKHNFQKFKTGPEAKLFNNRVENSWNALPVNIKDSANTMSQFSREDTIPGEIKLDRQSIKTKKYKQVISIFP